MYAVVLEFKEKSIMVKNIETEKVSYLVAPNENLEIGDTLQVEINDSFFSGGRAFFKGDYSKLNDGIRTFENCLKCETPLRKPDKPLCYTCWKSLVKGEKTYGKTESTPMKIEESRKEKPYLEKKEMSFKKLGRESDLSPFQMAFSSLASLISIKEEIVNFSYGKVKEGLSSLENKLDEKNRRILRKIINQFEEVDKEYFKFSDIKGVFFEIATYQLIREIISRKPEEFGIKKISASYERFLKDPDYRYEADGEIQFNIAKKGFGDVWALYDCKAYSKGYNIKEHLEKMINYLKIKQHNLREKREFKYFIVISGEFTGDPQYHVQKFSDFDKEKMRFILITGKQLLRLYDEQADRFWRGKNFYDKFPWENILEPDSKSPIHLVEDKEVSRLIKKARE